MEVAELLPNVQISLISSTCMSKCKLLLDKRAGILAALTGREPRHEINVYDSKSRCLSVVQGDKF